MSMSDAERAVKDIRGTTCRKNLWEDKVRAALEGLKTFASCQEMASMIVFSYIGIRP